MTEYPLLVIQVIHRDGQAAEQAEAIKVLRRTNISTAIVRRDRSLLFVTKALLIYTGAFEPK